jgi:hypothetical protein
MSRSSPERLILSFEFWDLSLLRADCTCLANLVGQFDLSKLEARHRTPHPTRSLSNPPSTQLPQLAWVVLPRPALFGTSSMHFHSLIYSNFTPSALYHFHITSTYSYPLLCQINYVQIPIEAIHSTSVLFSHNYWITFTRASHLQTSPLIFHIYHILAEDWS